MDKQAAINLISNTFNCPFDENRFSNFARNLLNDIDESKAFPYLYGTYIRHSFADHVKQYRRIGIYTDPNGERIDVLIVHLKRETALEHARTRQRNFIAWYLNGGRGGVLRDAALVAFASPDLDDWRFSYVRMEYKEEVTESGKVRVKEELTPAKRYSFLVGKNEPNHTARQQLLPLLKNYSRNPTLSELEDAFSVEAVTKQFYLDYKGLFERLTEELDRILKKDSKIKQEFEAKSIDTANFAKKLLGQIVFLYFLQKKGWLGVPKDERWGKGDKKFLGTIFKRCVTEGGNFFNDYLEYLFYEALATTEGRATIDLSYYQKFDCKIPFLNGGLSEATYDWKNTNILLPDELFSNKDKTKAGDTGTGILDVFDRYNFTVKEDEPLEKEVAVDPEMLGKVFENLLPENLRKGQGAYYTPREIVHYMCQESLINYLDTVVNTGKTSLSQDKPTQEKLFGEPEPEQLSLKGTGYKTVIPKKHIEDFIHKGEFAIEHDTAKEEGTTSYKYQIDESIRKNARLLDEKLKAIKICDPAIGSGAFPVGMMHEIVKARNVLETYLKTGRSAYDFKRHCIQESIYGVDIDPGAIEIAKLRLWLSLVVDEENYLNIKPLPNLDYKIMQGNSLLEDFHGVSLNLEKNEELLFSENEELDLLIEGLHKKQSEFFNAIHHSDKNRLREEVEDAIVKVFHYELKRRQEQYFKALDRINKMANGFPKEEDRKKCYDAEKAKLDKRYKFDFEVVENELREMTHGNKMRNFFPWKLYFADLFRKNGGFDVVIANPPYLRIQEIQKNDSQLATRLKNSFLSASGSFDIYACFVELAIRLIRDKGNLAYILPHKFFQATFGKNLRQLISSKRMLRQIVDFGSSQVFETATTYTCLLFLSHQNDSFKFAELKPDAIVNDLPEIFEIITGNEKTETEKVAIKIISNTDVSEKEWYFSAGHANEILFKLRTQPRTLSDVCAKIFQGIATSADKIYFLEHISEENGVVTAYSKSLNKKIIIEKDFVKPLLKGVDVHRYLTLTPHIWSIFPYKIENGKAILYSQNEIKKFFPMAWKYLLENKRELENRERGRMKHDKFYAYIYPKNLTEFEGEKIVTPDIASRCQMSLDNKGIYHTTTIYSFLFKKVSNESIKYYLALLNSKLLWYFVTATGSILRGNYFRFKTNYLMPFPIPSELSQADQQPFVALVDQILFMKKSDPQADTTALEAKINRMVYDLYGLTAEEIAIVEESAGR